MPIPNLASVVAPVAYKISPAVYVVRFVPPLATPNVPARVIVPEVVTGPPDVVKPVVPPDTLTLVTVPVPVIDDQTKAVPFHCK